jgi:hypothetical protein
MSGPFKLELFHEVLEYKNCTFICCASFEDRCFSIASRIKPNQIKKALICEHEDATKYVERNTNKILSHFGQKSEKVALNLSDPIKTINNLVHALEVNDIVQSDLFLVDISTFTHESLLILLNLLQSKKKKEATVWIIYTTALDYSTQHTKTDKWLSKGIKQIRSVIGFPGLLFPSKKLHLIVLAGFEEERANKLIENYEANFISIGVGSRTESIHPSLYELNNSYHKRLCNLYQNIETFTFSLINPFTAKKNFQEQIAKHPECNVVIAPLNTKISTVGAALTAMENPEIQLCYAQPNYYNVESYSSPGSEFYLFDLTKSLS